MTASSRSATNSCNRAARLREPPSHLARANTIFITKSDGKTGNLRLRITELNSTAAIIECVHHPLYLEDVVYRTARGSGHSERAQGRVVERHRPAESFEAEPRATGRGTGLLQTVADHHRFTSRKSSSAINRGKKRQGDVIITTQKDAVRFPKIDRRDLAIYFMRVEIKIVSGADDFQDCVAASVFAEHGQTAFFLARALVVFLQALPIHLGARLGRAGGALASGSKRHQSQSPRDRCLDVEPEGQGTAPRDRDAPPR